MSGNPLFPIIEELSRAHQGVTIAQYMALCLGHPQYGYYTTREPFGAAGDFTTAPEISQLFGEIIAVWVMATWQHMGEPENIQLVELGPGRGTLMADVWRGLKALPSLRGKVSIHLVEFSPRLQVMQKEKLADAPVTWHEAIDFLPHAPSIILANEFFDALPIEQAIFHNGTWHQRTVITDEEDMLFGIGKPLQGIFVKDPMDGAIFEYAPMAADIMDRLCAFLKQNGGAMLAIDYGDDTELDERTGETLQALFEKKPSPVLENAGQADLTSHVAFSSLKQIAEAHQLGTVFQTQREFLTQHGIRLRAEKLLSHATPEQAETIKSALNRLVDADQMGDLFKVLQVTA